MDPVSMSSLYLAEEARLKNELRADDLIDRNRVQSVSRLSELLDGMLLRYNAACADDRTRQAIADCQTAPVRDMLELINAGTAEKEIARRPVRVGAVICLLLAVISSLVAALLIRSYYAAGCVCMAGAALSGFLSGILWHGEREVRVHAGLDPELVLRTMRKVSDTMDRKTEEFLEQEQVWLREGAGSAPASAEGSALDPESLELVSALLEALYSDNGEFALRQLKKLLPWLSHMGIEAVDYTEDTQEYFELLPTRRGSQTLRPALLSGERLLLAGRAVQHAD